VEVCHLAVCTDPGALNFVRILIVVGMGVLVWGMAEGKIVELVGKKTTPNKLVSPPDTECPIHKQWVKPLGACSECGWERPTKRPSDD